MPVGYRAGHPEQMTAWKVLQYEHDVLGNEHIREDLARFLQLKWVSDPVKCKWAVALRTFRSRYGDVAGMWVLPDKHYARERYGEGGEPIFLVEYSGYNVVINMDDGIFVLGPFTGVVEAKGVNPRKGIIMAKSKVVGKSKRPFNKQASKKRRVAGAGFKISPVVFGIAALIGLVWLAKSRGTPAVDGIVRR